MRLRWLEEREQSWIGSLALLPLWFASKVYAAVAALHRTLSERGWLPRRRLAVPVISVGNLVVGGTAKTPLAAWIARELRKRGHRVALASRGYGREGREPVEIVSDGRFVRGSAESAGDEALLLAAQAPGVPVLVGRDRGLVGLRALSAFDAEVLVLDDAFQHHRLHRTLDVVSFDGRLGFGNGHALPRGPLREPLAALSRADAVVVVDGPLPEVDEALLARRVPAAQRIAARRQPCALRALSGGEPRSPAELAGAPVGLLAGVAQPASVRRTLESLGAQVVAERLFRDHHRYQAADLAGLAELAPHWITTEKDAVKLLPAWAGDAKIEVLAIEIALEDPKAFVDWLESRIR